jgi:hypothetical protein
MKGTDRDWIMRAMSTAGVAFEWGGRGTLTLPLIAGDPQEESPGAHVLVDLFFDGRGYLRSVDARLDDLAHEQQGELSLKEEPEVSNG